MEADTLPPGHQSRQKQIATINAPFFGLLGKTQKRMTQVLKRALFEKKYLYNKIFGLSDYIKRYTFGI